MIKNDSSLTTKTPHPPPKIYPHIYKYIIILRAAEDESLIPSKT